MADSRNTCQRPAFRSQTDISVHRLAPRLSFIRFHFTRFLLAFVLGLISIGPVRATTYRWVDQNGKVHYSDVMPQSQAGQDHAELDNQGRVVKETRRARLSPEEQKRKAEQAALEQANKRRLQQIRRHDQALLATYTNESEIMLTRDRAIALENLNIRGLKTRQDAAAAKLARANSGLDKARRTGLPDYAGNTQMRIEAQRELTDIAAAIQVREAAIERFRQQYEEDAKRFRELQAGTATSRR